MSEIEARIARRLAIAFWKGERAERIEVALFDAAPKLRPPQVGFQWEQAYWLDPSTSSASTPCAATRPSRAARSAAA